MKDTQRRSRGRRSESQRRIHICPPSMAIKEVNLRLPSALKEFVASAHHAQHSLHVTDNGHTNSKGFKAFLESLYLWFIYSYEFDSRKTFGRVNLEDVVCISKTLFEELSKRLCVPLDSSSANQSLGGEIQKSESDAVEDEIVMLLRCCIASINFLQTDQSVLVQRCEFLHMILSMLCSCQKIDGCKFSSTLNPDTNLRLVCRILEVFVDELITNKGLSKYIQISAFSSENMCSCLEFGYVLKVVSAHFVQSYSGAQTFRGLMENLIWSCKENGATPEISLTAAVSLLINPALDSPPAFLHAHLISMISDVIGRVAVYDHTGFNLIMPAIEKSVTLYQRQLAKLVQNLFLEATATRGVGCQRPFESYVCPTVNGKLISLIKNIDLDCSSCMMMNSKMVVILKSYVKENLHLVDESCRSAVSLFLSFLLEKADESKDALLHINGNVSPEDICLLASILKLMSCSLLYISSDRNSVHCELLAHIIDSSFGQYRIELPVQKLLHDKFEAQFSRVNGTKLMFVHFTGLLSVCLAGGFEILAKGCLYLMLNVLNLLFFEEGSLNFLSQLVSSTSISVCVDSSEGLNNRRCSVRLALQFKEIQMSCSIRKGPASGSQDEEQEACNGVAFLKCLSNNSGASDPCLEEELVDFIQCKQGKDYSSWLKNRARCRIRKLKKLEDQALERKKAAWRSVLRTRKPRQDKVSEKPVKRFRR